jgi:hypothetical protein
MSHDFIYIVYIYYNLPSPLINLSNIAFISVASFLALILPRTVMTSSRVKPIDENSPTMMSSDISSLCIVAGGGGGIGGDAGGG